MTSGLPSPDARSLSGLGREAFTECGGAKFGPSEDSFCQVRRLIAMAMGQEAGEKWTAAVNLQPTLPKSDRLLARLCHFPADFRSLPTASPCQHWVLVWQRNVVP